MIGGEHDTPGISTQEEQLQTDDPLERGHCGLVLVLEGNDAAAGLQLDIDVDPFPPAALVQQVLDRAVGRDRGGRAEHDLSNVYADLRMSIDVLDYGRRGRAPARTTVGLERDGREVGAAASKSRHARLRTRDVRRKSPH